MDLAKAIASHDFIAAAKVFDKELRTESSSGESRSQLLCNRAYCYQQAGLLRKALKDFEEACQLQVGCIRALVGRGEVLHLLKRLPEAAEVWRSVSAQTTATSDVSKAFRAAALLKDADSMLSPQQPPPTPSAATNGHTNGHSSPADLMHARRSVQARDTSSGSTLMMEEGPIANGHGAAGSSRPSFSRSQASAAPAGSRTASGSRAAAAGAASSMAGMQKSMEQQSAAVSLAVAQINAGKIQEAEELLDAVVGNAGDGRSANLGAFVARGTARALQRKLEGAVEDFSEAVRQMPSYGDGWKRRGQARAALEQHEEALEDLLKARDLQRHDPMAASQPETGEIEVELGILHQKMRNFRKAVLELQKATKLGPENAQAWNLRGQCHTSLGDIAEGVRCYEQAVKLQPGMREAWINMGLAEKE
ncbi:hypothetical protein WJX84_007873, partial [Apatococcus fuscideae]